MTKVLVVDDDPAIVNLTVTTLQNNGFSVITASYAKDGIDTAKREKPDFILLDEILPDMPGTDALRALKQDAATQNIPVAIFSDYSNDAYAAQAKQNGAIDYILKYETEPEVLVKTIKEHTSQAAPTDSTPPVASA